MRYLTN